MPGVHASGVTAVQGDFTITVTGASTLVQTLRRLTPEAEREMKAELQKVGDKVVSEASGHAAGFAYDGDYAGSFSVKNLARGVRVISSDPGAGAIEFAKKGSVYLRGPRAGRPIGTPPDAKPKALIRAANDNEDSTVSAVRAILQRACDQVRGA